MTAEVAVQFSWYDDELIGAAMAEVEHRFPALDAAGMAEVLERLASALRRCSAPTAGGRPKGPGPPGLPTLAEAAVAPLVSSRCPVDGDR